MKEEEMNKKQLRDRARGRQMAKSTSSDGLIFQLTWWLTSQLYGLFHYFLQGDFLSVNMHSAN